MREPKKKALLFEPDKIWNERLTAMLTEDGFEVRSAVTRETTLRAILDWPPDLIISEPWIPNESVLELVLFAQANAQPDVKSILLYTGSNRPPQVLRHFNAAIQKTYLRSNLRKKIRELGLLPPSP